MTQEKAASALHRQAGRHGGEGGKRERKRVNGGRGMGRVGCEAKGRRRRGKGGERKVGGEHLKLG